MHKSKWLEYHFFPIRANEHEPSEEEINPNFNSNSNSGFNKEYDKLDIDKYINWYSYETIYKTTGCVFGAIDLVMRKQVTNDIALIKLPGNHIAYYGPTKIPLKNPLFGFCLVNNVGIAAAYAKYK